MSTRARIRVLSREGEDEKVALEAYQHSDGYPSWCGLQIAELLSEGEVVNGIGGNSDTIQFNGVGCLAAHLAWKFKGGKNGARPGGFYIEGEGRVGLQAYQYDIVVTNPGFGAPQDSDVDPIIVRISDCEGDLLWEGTPKALLVDVERVDFLADA